MTLRMIRRAVVLVFVLSASVLRYWFMRVAGPRSLEQGPRWLQKTCIRVLRSMNVRCDLKGRVPSQGLVVSNHLSYLDILVLSASMPCFFVAKKEVRRWPYFGQAAHWGGTMFLDRASFAGAERIAEMIGERLKLPIPVLLFPEGTSTDGTMQRFHNWLYEPAVLARAPITAASIRYVTSDGTPERDVCWFGNDNFGPHLLKVLRMPEFRAELHFGRPRLYAHRRTAANETFAEIRSMREQVQTPELEPVELSR